MTEKHTFLGTPRRIWRNRPPHAIALIGVFLWLPWTFLVTSDTGLWWLWLLGIFAWLLCIWDIAWAIRTPRLMPMERVNLTDSGGREVTFRIVFISHDREGITVTMETEEAVTRRNTIH